MVVYSLNGHGLHCVFPFYCAATTRFPAKLAVLDGEVVASNADVSPNFARLHMRWAKPGIVHLWAFDLLAFNGRELRLQPLLK